MNNKIFLFLILIFIFPSVLAWQDTNYGSCRLITINNKASKSVQDFPALINLSYQSTMGVNLSTIRIMDGSCNSYDSELAWELDNTDNSVYAGVWVRIPLLKVGINNISLFYDNNTGVSNTENSTGVWDNFFKAVYHMNNYNSTTTLDSTKYDNDITYQTATLPNTKSGVFGSSQHCNSSNSDYMLSPSSSSLHDVYENLTVEEWSYKATGESVSATWDIEFQMNYASGSDQMYTMAHNSGGKEHVFIRTTTGWGNTGLGTTFSYDEWEYYLFTYNGANMKAYRNGINEFTDPQTGNLVPASLGKLSVCSETNSGSPGQFYTGRVDELRYSNITRSLSYINMTYLIVNNQSNVVNIGSEQLQNISNSSSCSCSGLNIDWVYNLSDSSCNVLNVDCDIGTGVLSFVGSGYPLKLNSTLSIGTFIVPSTNVYFLDMSWSNGWLKFN